MSSATQPLRAKDAWQNPRNARTLRAFMVLRNEEIAARIRELRGDKPQTLVAEEMGVAERTYQGWEQGETKPSYRSLQKLAAYFGVGEEFILTGGRRNMSRPRPATGETPDVFPVTVNRLDGPLEARISAIEETLAQILGRLETAAGERQEIAAALADQTELLADIKAERLAAIAATQALRDEGPLWADRLAEQARRIFEEGERAAGSQESKPDRRAKARSPRD